MTTVAIIVAAGRGTRAGGSLPKQWQMLGARPVLAHAIEAMAAATDHQVVVLHPDDMEQWTSSGLQADKVVYGGATRDASVRAGLEAAADLAPKTVLIHDAARPLTPKSVIDRVITALATHSAAAPALSVTDALWYGEDDIVTGTHPRDGLYRAQTPQGFDYKSILEAHSARTEPALDDVQVARDAGHKVAIVQGSEQNMKITGPDDLARAAQMLEQTMDIRLGNGYDVHRFVPGDHVWLCGVKIDHDRTLQGHSDADVGMHAVTDAIYGALGQGDIGQHFPPSDEQWKGARSDIFLRHAAQMARQAGYEISNVDCTLICEFPKIGPHQTAMKDALSDIIGIPADRISVKATTSERLGFTGRGEGIASIATASLVRT